MIRTIEVYRGNNPLEAHYVEGALREAGIACTVENQGAASVLGETEIFPLRVRIHDAARLAEADSIVKHSLGTLGREHENAPGDEWNCPQCKQRISAQFTACWNCGGEREA
jgi:hypothetical protein